MVLNVITYYVLLYIFLKKSSMSSKANCYRGKEDLAKWPCSLPRQMVNLGKMSQEPHHQSEFLKYLSCINKKNEIE